MEARERSPTVRAYGALSRRTIRLGCGRARDGGRRQRRHAGRKGRAFPLAWAAAVPACADRRVRESAGPVRPDDDVAIREAHWGQLDTLQAWCRGAGKPLVVEMLVDAVANPRTCSTPPTARDPRGVRGEAYRRGLAPQFCKIEGTGSADGARWSTMRWPRSPRHVRFFSARPPIPARSNSGSPPRRAADRGRLRDRTLGLLGSSMAYLSGTATAEHGGQIASTYLGWWERGGAQRAHPGAHRQSADQSGNPLAGLNLPGMAYWPRDAAGDRPTSKKQSRCSRRLSTPRTMRSSSSI